MGDAHLSRLSVPDPLSSSSFYPLSPSALEAIDAIEYITEYMKKEEQYKMVSTTYSN